jgi:hypothetical protein
MKIKNFRKLILGIILIFLTIFLLDKSNLFIDKSFTALSTEHIAEYKSKQGWSIKYDDNSFKVQEEKNGVMFIKKPNINSLCIENFGISTILENPENKPLDELSNDLKNQDSTFLNLDNKEITNLSKYTSWKSTYTDFNFANDKNNRIKKAVSYTLTAGKKVYILRYEIWDLVMGKKLTYPEGECEQNEKAIQLYFNTFTSNI